MTPPIDELVDVINGHNQVIGTTGKSLAHRDGLLHRIVIGELINSQGEYCFVKQAGDRQDPDQFVSPVGGHVGAGESIESAMVRECSEECGFIPTDFYLVGQTIYSRKVIGRQENHLFFVHQIQCDRDPILNHESTEFRWFSVGEIQQILRTTPQTFGAAWHHVFKNVFPTIYL